MYYNSEWNESLTPVAKFLLDQQVNPQEKIPHPVFSNRVINCICTLELEEAERDEVIVDPGRIGVDKLAIEVPLYGRESDPKSFLASLRNSEIGKWGRTATVKLDVKSDETMFVQFLQSRWSVYIEFNPSRLYDPDGCTLAPVDSIPQIVERLIRDVFEFAGDALPYFAINSRGISDWDNWDPDWKTQILISRLDATRDFLIPDERFKVDLYRDIRPRSAKGTRITYGAGGYPELWEGIYAGKHGTVKLYDKYRKAKKDKIPNLPSKGTKRFEFCAGRSELDRVHIHNLSMLNKERFNKLIYFGWNKSRLDVRKPLSGAWAEMILNSCNNDFEALAAIGMLFCKWNDLDISIEKDIASQLKSHISNSGIDLRRSLNNQGLKRIQLNISEGKLVEHDWRPSGSREATSQNRNK